MEVNDKTMGRHSPRHLEKVAAPAIHAGVGDALRRAYDLNGQTWCFTKFEDLLARLK